MSRAEHDESPLTIEGQRTLDELSSIMLRLLILAQDAQCRAQQKGRAAQEQQEQQGRKDGGRPRS